MVNVTIYTAPGCGPCTATKRAMTAREIPFTEVNTAEDAAARAYLRDDLGYVSTPVTALTYADGSVHSWGGFNLEQIKRLQQRFALEGAGLDAPDPQAAAAGVGPHHSRPEVAGAA